MTDDKDSMSDSDGIARWLFIATAGLADGGMDRVGREIRAHFADAVTAARQEGKSLVEAEQIAVNGLGDPKKANRVFLRTYLTEWDEKELERIEWSFWNGLKHGMILLFFVFLIGVWEMPRLVQAIQNPGPREALWGALGAAAVIMSLRNYWLVRHLVRTGAQDRLPLYTVKMELQAVLIGALFIGGLGVVEGGSFPFLMMISAMVIGFSGRVFRTWSIYRKLRVLGEADSHGE